jgi:hypothetical protein
MFEIPATDIFQAYTFQILPYPFIWIQIRRIWRQPFQMYPTSAFSGKKFLDILASMNRRAIPYDKNFSRNVLEQMTQKFSDIRSFETMIPNLYV